MQMWMGLAPCAGSVTPDGTALGTAYRSPPVVHRRFLLASYCLVGQFFSLSGFAVIQDCSSANTSWEAAEALWHETGSLPPAFQVVSQGCVPGLQTINRAELEQVVMACQHASALGAPDTCIGTDSAFVVREWSRLRAGGHGTYPDLTRQLLQSWRRNFTVYKAAAHTDLRTVHGPQWWTAAANAAADKAAKHAVDSDYQFLRSLVNEIAQEARDQADEHLIFCRFLVAISAEENRLKKVVKREELRTDADDLSEVANSVQFQRWLALSPGCARARALPRLEHDWLLASSWPPWFTWPLMQWLCTLNWTLPADSPAVAMGTTYAEFIVNFVVCTAVMPPAGQEDLFPLQSPDHMERPRAFRQLSLSFVDCTRQLERLSGATWLPSRNVKCTSLRAIGQVHPRIGVQGRPTFAQPERTFQVLQRLVDTSSVDVLLPCAQEYAEGMKAAEPVIIGYRALTRAQRVSLARWLRRLRRT